MALNYPDIKDDQAINAIARLEYFIKYDHPKTKKPKYPKARYTYADQLFYGRWYAGYVVHRSEGMDHETAIRTVEHELRVATGIEPPPPPPPAPAYDRIDGQLRVDGTAYKDDQGFVLPILCHFGEAFSAWTRRPDDVKRQLDVIAQAGYHGIRFWDVLGYYDGGWAGREVTPIPFTNKSGGHVPATERYYGLLESFLHQLKDRGLVAHHSRGDLNSWQNADILNHCALVGQVQRSVGLSVIGLNEAVNECDINIRDYSPANLNRMIDAIANPGVIEALSTPEQQTEETDDLLKWLRDVVYVHGFRGGDRDAVGQVRHIFSLRYDGGVKVAGKPGWQGEPHGHDMSGPIYTRPDTMALCAFQALAARQAWVWTGFNGVFFNGPIEHEPGFWEVPKVRQWLPADVMTYPDAFHGGTRWAGKRWIKADAPDGSIRCNHVVRGADGVLVVHAQPGRTWNLPVERAFLGVVVDPINGPGEPREWHVGQTFDFDGRDRTGVGIVGRLL